MKNPLRKRLPRELKGELGKYLDVYKRQSLSWSRVSNSSGVTTETPNFTESNMESLLF